jgi:hypothetical protein
MCLTQARVFHKSTSWKCTQKVTDAGAMSMAAGEYISVASQKDTEQADVDKERIAQEKGPEMRARELEELTQIYVDRGLEYALAKEVPSLHIKYCVQCERMRILEKSESLQIAYASSANRLS